MSARMKCHPLRQHGFSLVELMVAMTLSLLLLAGALSILHSSKLTYSENERIARLQEAGRTVIELVLRDARSAGFLGCSRPVNGDEFSNGLTNGTTSLLWNFGESVRGYEVGGTLPTDLVGVATGVAAGTDVLILRTTRQGQPVFRTNAPVTNTASPIQVDRQTGITLPAGTTMIIGDCEGSSVFRATGFTDVTPTTATIAHAAAAGAGNNASASLTRGFAIGAQVMPVETVIYFVAPSGNGTGPALWQRVGAAAAQELVEGVENLQVLYGVDTDNDLLANQYQAAGAVTNWNRVVSLSLALLVRSPEETGFDRDTRTYDLLGTPVGPFNDRRQRSVFATTVVLRNRTS